MLSLKRVVLLFSFLTITATMFAQTTVQSIISSNQVWKLSASPYIVTGNVLIDTGASVTVEPGVEIESQGNFKVIVKGQFNAEGTSSSVINVTSLSFQFDQESVGHNFTTGGGSQFSYCVFEGLNAGGQKQIDLKGVDMLVSNCEFNQGYYNVYGYASGNDSVRVRIENSVFNGNSQGYVMYMSGTKTYAEIDECVAKDMGGMFLAKHTTITKSLFYNFRYFSGIRLSSTDYLKLECNAFVKFSSYLLDFSFLNSDAEIDIQYNHFDTCDYILNYNIGNPLTNFTFTNNNIMSYNKNSVKCYSGNTPGSAYTLDMTGNYWGTTDTNDINEGIYDFRDDITAGAIVDYSSYLSAPVTNCTPGNIASVKGVEPAYEFETYPNPVSNVLNVEGLMGRENTISIYTMSGILVYESQVLGSSQKVDVSEFSNGVYVLKVTNEELASASRKVLVRH